MYIYMYVYVNKIVNDYIRSLYCVLLMWQPIWVVTAEEWSQDSSVSIVMRLCTGGQEGIVFVFLAGERESSLLQRMQTSSGVHTASF